MAVVHIAAKVVDTAGRQNHRGGGVRSRNETLKQLLPVIVALLTKDSPPNENDVDNEGIQHQSKVHFLATNFYEQL